MNAPLQSRAVESNSARANTEGEFQYREVARTSMMESRTWGSLLTGAVIQSALYLLLLVLAHLSLPSPIIKPLTRTTPILSQSPHDPAPALPRPPFRLVRMSPVMVSFATPPPDPRSRIRYRFERDQAQVLPQVLAKFRGSIGFADREIVRYRFEAPDWLAIGPPEQGISVRSFYYLFLDERDTPYTFLNQLRSLNPSLVGLAPYALFGFDFQSTLETAIRNAAADQCDPEDDLSAVLSMRPDGDFSVQKLDCLSKRKAAQ